MSEGSSLPYDTAAGASARTSVGQVFSFSLRQNDRGAQSGSMCRIRPRGSGHRGCAEVGLTGELPLCWSQKTVNGEGWKLAYFPVTVDMRAVWAQRGLGPSLGQCQQTGSNKRNRRQKDLKKLLPPSQPRRGRETHRAPDSQPRSKYVSAAWSRSPRPKHRSWYLKSE